jgi:metallo-beta-lactamase family protein
MKIRFHGATGDVTGSAYHVLTKHASVLVDCGLFQGDRETKAKNRNHQPLEGGRLDAVVLTHGHLDHIGRLPLLTKNGYDGPIYATKPTFELATLILRDSIGLQRGDLERENRKRFRMGLEPLEPLFTEDDVQSLRPLAKAIPYREVREIAPGISVRLLDAGHVVGSASVEMTVQENGTKKVVVFSGDLGPRGAPLMNDPHPFEKADVVIMESTYGDRNHRSLRDTAIEGRKTIAKAIEQKAKILVPVFAIGRTQLLLYLLAGAFKRGTLPAIPIYLDSPMAIEATKIYRAATELLDQEAKDMIKSGELRKHLATLKPCSSADDSRGLNDVKGPCLIMAGNGMCSGGRITHHIRHNVGRPGTAILIVGFQSPGTLGRQLVDGAKTVTMYGEKLPVKASIHTMGGFSAHADQKGLMEWFDSVAPSKPRLVITHGEEIARKTFAGLVKAKHGIKAELPKLNDAIQI